MKKYDGKYVNCGEPSALINNRLQTPYTVSWASYTQLGALCSYKNDQLNSCKIKHNI